MDFSRIKIRKISPTDKDTEFIMSLRNDPDVQKRFISSGIVSRESHLKYLKKANANGDMVFIIEKDHEPIGQVAYVNIDMINKTLEGGAFVIRPDIIGVGIGAYVEYNMIDYAFSVIGISRIYARVLRTNIETFKLHKNFGFQEEARSKVNNEYYRLFLLKKDWDKERFKKIFGERTFNG